MQEVNHFVGGCSFSMSNIAHAIFDCKADLLNSINIHLIFMPLYAIVNVKRQYR